MTEPTPWSPTWYSFDIESTGVDVFTDRIVSATVVKVEGTEPVMDQRWLLDPGIEIPAAATEVHGITTEHAREHGVTAKLGVRGIRETVTKILRSGFPLVVFNAAYDLSLLDCESRRYDLGSLHDELEPQHWHKIVDPFVLAKGMDRLYAGRRRSLPKGLKYTLGDLCKRYRIPLDDAHDATADATAACLLGIELVRQDSYLAGLPPSELHVIQRTWRRELQRSLRNFFDSQGYEHDGCDGSWPLHTTLMKEAVNR